MAEKAGGGFDPGGEGGGFGGGGGGITLTDEDAGFDEIVEGYNTANKGEGGPGAEGSEKPVKKAAPVKAPLGSHSNPIHSKTGGL